MPGILIETGFMTNPKDRQMIQSEQFGRALAKSIVSGLKTYYGQ
jgi:N-acetylmuramoyl-L-alanine amidase